MPAGLVSPDNVSIDLVTGTTVRLGSVTGGARYVGDDRLVIASNGRIDAVHLDATARWTWPTPEGSQGGAGRGRQEQHRGPDHA